MNEHKIYICVQRSVQGSNLQGRNCRKGRHDKLAGTNQPTLVDVNFGKRTQFSAVPIKELNLMKPKNVVEGVILCVFLGGHCRYPSKRHAQPTFGSPKIGGSHHLFPKVKKIYSITQFDCHNLRFIRLIGRQSPPAPPIGTSIQRGWRTHLQLFWVGRGEVSRANLFGC